MAQQYVFPEDTTSFLDVEFVSTSICGNLHETGLHLNRYLKGYNLFVLSISGFSPHITTVIWRLPCRDAQRLRKELGHIDA